MLSVTVPREIGGCPIDGTLEKNKIIRYQFPIPAEGMFVGICVSEGYITAYASLFVPNPSTFYDWTLEVEHDSGKSENCEYFFVDPDKLPDKSSPNSTLEISTTDHNLFLAMTGKSRKNTFALESYTEDADSNISKYT